MFRSLFPTGRAVPICPLALAKSLAFPPMAMSFATSRLLSFFAMVTPSAYLLTSTLSVIDGSFVKVQVRVCGVRVPPELSFIVSFTFLS